MAKKSSKSTKSKKQTSSPVEKAAKKAYKANPKAFVISIVAIVLVIAIATAVVYFAFPDTWDKIVSSIIDNGTNGGGTDNGGNGGNSSLTSGSGEIVVHMINVGQGDCIFIKFPDGKDMIIDSGSTTRPYDNFDKDVVLDYLRQRIDGNIEYLMLTHADTDHVSYLDEVLSEFQVGNVYMPNIRSNNLDKSVKIGGRDMKVGDLDAGKLKKFTDKDTIDTERYTEFFIAALSEPNCNITLNIGKYEIRGQDYTFTFYCLSQEEWDSRNLKSATQINAVSPIGILEYAGRRLVFTGDSNNSNEKYYCETYPYVDCDVLKVAHHGSRTSSSEEFLKHVKCEYAVISVGDGNSYGHPEQEALDRLKANGIQKIHRTDKCGNVVLTVSHTGEMAFSCEKQCAA